MGIRATPPDVQLSDRYTAGAGRALISGTQALVRLLIEQRRLDASRGLSTGVFVSGYPGSPLGGLDREILSARAHLEPQGIVFEAGVNEELAATAVGGSQLVGELPGRTRDGVVGFWYGKAPGLDRAADAIRHANVSGTAHLGGAVALIGDDPMCKSSTLPSSCELMAESLVLPLLAPACVDDVVRLGLHAVAMSRDAGLWTAMKIVSDVADASSTVDLGEAAQGVPLPPSESRGGPPMLLGLSSVAAEHDLMGARLARAREYGRVHALNRVVFEPGQARTAILSPGAAFASLTRALSQLGLGDDELDELGIRLVKLDLVWPLHPDDVLAFADGVQELVVVEDKRPFVERQLRDLLYGRAGAPPVLGKHDRDGRTLISSQGAVDPDAAARALGRLWADRLPTVARERVESAAGRVRATSVPLPLARTPFFCSGCPHNLSTRAAEGQLVGAGIGCHSLIWLDPSAQRGRLLGAPQMGGEGAQWIGMAPFTDDRHYVQNIGDGTFHHSGSLAIRAAVAARSTITFRLLYNDAIAMTGGQRAPGRLGVVDLVNWLALEGVSRIVVSTEEPASFAGAALPANASVRDRRELDSAQQELAALEGVTVLVHTDRCATEERRLRKRGKLPTPAKRAWINERVCEGCGDCGRKSSCLSVVPVETELGRKTQIHQSSCTQDLACLEGDCPSFVLVTPGDQPPRAVAFPALHLPDPEPIVAHDAQVLVRMPGIGGSGVVTVSQILQMAALLEGRWSAGLDQTGLAQKGGPVISDVRIGPGPDAGAPRAGAGEVDVLLGLDLLGAVAAGTLRTADPQRTIAVINTHETATAGMVSDTSVSFPPLGDCVAQIESSTRAERALYIDAGSLSEALFADHMPANLIMLGAAYQHGCLPVSAASIERAIHLNGASVPANLAAFAWGRAAAADPVGVAAALADARPVGLGGSRLSTPAPSAVRRRLEGAELTSDLRDLVERRAGDLCAYQDITYALTYIDDVLSVLAVERQLGCSDTPVSRAYAVAMYKLMAYKDEYEVARLHLDSLEQAQLTATFGSDAKLEILLHPPLLRALGLKRKLRLGASARPLLRTLRAARRLRGTGLDPFGQTAMRRLERTLIAEHRQATREALGWLTADTQEQVAALVALPDLVRGYEEIKRENVGRYRTAVTAAMDALAGAPTQAKARPDR